MRIPAMHPSQMLMILFSTQILGSHFSVAQDVSRSSQDPTYQTLVNTFEGEYWIDRENCTNFRGRQTYVKIFLRRRKAPDLDSFNASFEGRYGSGGPSIYIGQAGVAYELSEPLLYETVKAEPWFESEPKSYRRRRSYLTLKPGLFRETGTSWAWERNIKKFTGYWSRSFEVNNDNSVTMKTFSRAWGKSPHQSSCRLVPRTPHNSKDQYDEYRKAFTGRFSIRRDRCNLFADHKKTVITLTVGHSYLDDVIELSAKGGTNQDPNQRGTFITIGDEGRLSLSSKPWKLANLIKDGWFSDSYKIFKTLDDSIETLNYKAQLQLKDKSVVEAQTYWAHPYGDEANRQYYSHTLKELIAPDKTSVLFKRTSKKYDQTTFYGSCLLQRE